MSPRPPHSLVGFLLLATAALGGIAASPADAAPAALQERTEVPAAGGELDDLTARVADQLRCPVCRNQSVLESSSALAREMQAEIRRRLARGETPEEVKAYFVSRYGEWILLQPPARGINLLVYLLPAAALLVGVYVVVRLVRRWTDEASTPGPDGEAGREAPRDGERLSEEEERRLHEVLEGGPGTS